MSRDPLSGDLSRALDFALSNPADVPGVGRLCQELLAELSERAIEASAGVPWAETKRRALPMPPEGATKRLLRDVIEEGATIYRGIWSEEARARHSEKMRGNRNSAAKGV